MFHIKVSYTSSSCSAFFALQYNHSYARTYTRIRQPIAREPRLTSSILARFFLLYVLRRQRQLRQWQEVTLGWETKAFVVIVLWNSPTVTDTSIFLHMKNFLLWIFSSSKNSFFFVFVAPNVCAQLWLLCVHESILSVEIYYKKEKEKVDGKAKKKYYERKRRCWCKSFISK